MNRKGDNMKIQDLVEETELLEQNKSKMLAQAKILVMEHMQENHLYDYESYSFNFDDNVDLHIVFKDFEFYWLGNEILFKCIKDKGFTYNHSNFEKYIKSVEKLIEKICKLDIDRVRIVKL